MDRWWITAPVFLAMAVGGSATAQTARSGGSANAQLVQQMQQLASERTALQGENEKLKAQLAEVTKARDALKSGHQASERRAKDAAAALAQSNTQREAVDQELTQTKAKMQELIAKFRETIQKLRDTETDNASLKQTLGGREHELTVCVDHNRSLYQLNDEVLTRLEKEGVFRRIAESEPFTRIKRFQLENYADESRAKAKDEVASPPKPPLPDSAPPAPDASSPPPPPEPR